jgi:hypothetical protein
MYWWRGRHRRRRQAPPDFPPEEARLPAIGFGEMGESEKNRGERREGGEKETPGEK